MLKDVNDGRDGAMDELMKVVYDDLQKVAEGHMAKRFGRGLAGITMEPAALVNESFLDIIRQRKAYDNRGQFFAIATKIMLRVLVDYQRRRAAAKRGGDVQKVTLDLNRHAASDDGRGRTEGGGSQIEVEALVEALERLETVDSRKADVVKLKVIWGLAMREIAGSLEISVATVERDWAFAKAWLAREAAMRDGPAESRV